jgi:hypothetical protein
VGLPLLAEVFYFCACFFSVRRSASNEVIMTSGVATQSVALVHSHAERGNEIQHPRSEIQPLPYAFIP